MVLAKSSERKRCVCVWGGDLAQTTERTVVAEVVDDIQKILYSTAEETVVEAA
jgi:hypothetical protein